MTCFQPAVLIVGAILMSGSTGCVRGVTYKVAMPESMTLGTIKEGDATLASASTTDHRPARVVAEATGK